ncbi:putative haloacid dehalogenase-like hydrolase PWA37_005374 [Arxiozyma heterogenica]|uniref:Uncharacterized protein n=1 Tax=Arxiozyma heterogenica TaxID=278026 RepID=A0AAN8A9Z3_9SACH|nr:hypothetical protein RI543_000306 [Kazachstania heterogenica]
MTRLDRYIGFSKQIKGVIFDMDGTLCLPQPWMFPEMRSVIGLNNKEKDILEFIEELPTTEDKKWAKEKIHEVEIKAMEEMRPQPGLIELMRFLTLNNFSKNICTRNVITPVNYLINKYIPQEWSKFDHILTREFRPTKPYPEPLLHISKLLETEPGQLIMVGDSFDDMKSGHSAGCITILLKNHVNGYLLNEHRNLIDFTVNTLDEIIPLLQGEGVVETA